MSEEAGTYDSLSDMARHLLDLGLHIFPVKDTGDGKKPLGRWRHGRKDYTTFPATPGEVDEWLKRGGVDGWAVISSPQSRTVILDIEKEMWQDEETRAAVDGVLDDCWPEAILKSKSGIGRHVYFQIPEGDMPAERAICRRAGVLRAEVRSPITYAVICDTARPLPRDFVPEDITRARFYERIAPLIELDETPEAECRPAPVKPWNGTPTDGTGVVLFDAVRDQVLPLEAVLPDGWQVLGRRDRDEARLILRPGSDSESSGNVLAGVIVIHSTNVSGVEPGRGYSPLGFIAATRFDGDYGAAARWVEGMAENQATTGEVPEGWPPEILEKIHEYRTKRKPGWFAEGGAMPLEETPEEWPEIAPLDWQPAPQIPTDMLPDPVAEFVDAAAGQTQAPRDLVLVAALATLSGATFGVYDVRVHAGWRAGPTVVQSIGLAASGERKSGVLDITLAPLRRAVERENLRRSDDAAAAGIRFDIAKKAKEKALKAGDIEAATEAAKDLARIEAEGLGQMHMILDDATTEALGVRMSRNRGVAMLASAEATALHTIAGRYNEGVLNVGLPNAGYDGVPYADTRIKRDDINISRAILPALVIAQPDVMGTYSNAAMEGSGFLGRYLLVHPVSMIGYRNMDPNPVPDRVLDEWENTVMDMAGRAIDILNSADPVVTLELAPAAARLLQNFASGMEAEKRFGGDLYGDPLGGWLEKQPARLARVAALFSLVAMPGTRVVGPESIERALRLHQHLLEHARSTFEVMRATRVPSRLQTLVVVMAGREEITGAEIRAAVGGQWIREKDALTDAMKTLESHGICRPAGTRKGGTPVWSINPDLQRSLIEAGMGAP